MIIIKINDVDVTKMAHDELKLLIQNTGTNFAIRCNVPSLLPKLYKKQMTGRKYSSKKKSKTTDDGPAPKSKKSKSEKDEPKITEAIEDRVAPPPYAPENIAEEDEEKLPPGSLVRILKPTGERFGFGMKDSPDKSFGL
jgi:hypothetical protein